MVDVSAKPLSARTAIAKGKIELQRKTMELISTDGIAKGNVVVFAWRGSFTYRASEYFQTVSFDAVVR